MNYSLLILGTIACLAGCSLVPKYERPASPVSGAWSISPQAASTNNAAGIDWSEFYGDPRLRKLIGLALENNRDLRVAALRVEQARAEYRIARSYQFSGVKANTSLVRQKTSGQVSEFNGGTMQSIYNVDIGAAYELDMFGRVRSLKKEALELYFATEEARKSVQIALVSQVAMEYFTQVRLLEAKAVANQTLETVQKSYNLIIKSFEAGAASELDLRTAEEQVQMVRVNAAGFLQLLAESEHALVVLVGQLLPNDLPAGQNLRDQRLLTSLPAEVPSEVLQRRPDILAAEHTLQAANADIGAARSAFFPRILLTGSAGTASAKLADLFTSPSATWSFSPQITIPIFNLGATKSKLDVAKLTKRIEIANYEKAIQHAFREVADSLSIRAILDEKLKAQESLLAAQQRRFDLITERYRHGVDSYVDVLLSQQALHSAQQNLLQYQMARLLNGVALYRSLGGGWKS